MKLFEIDDNNNVKLNKPWIMLIPEFKALFIRDKGNNHATEPGRYKYRAIKEFSFIYFNVDFGSPIRDWELNDKRKEALVYANLVEEDIDSKVKEAEKKYEELQIKASRSLRTYRSMLKGLDALDKHFEDINFDLTDKQGKQLHSPDTFVNNTAKMNKVYDELEKFQKRVESDLTNDDSGIRGNAILGDLEAKKTNVNSTWNEQGIADGSSVTQGGEIKSSTNFTALSGMLSNKKSIDDIDIDNAVILGE